MTRPILLITGFNAFGGSAANPTQVIVEEVERRGNEAGIVAEVLPTEFATAGVRVRELIASHRPAVYLGLGLCAASGAIRLETTAVNWMESTMPDNSGFCAMGMKICEGRDEMIRSTLPLDSIAGALRRSGIAHEFSDSAGRFVCNHVFYSAADEIERQKLATIFGFVHVPWGEELGPSSGVSMPMAKIRRAIDCIIDELRRG